MARFLYTLNSPPGGTSAVAFSRDDSRIAAAGTDGILRIYDSSSGKLVAQNEDLLGESFAIDFSADGRQVVAGGADKAAIFVDAATGKFVRRMGLADVVAYLAISPDGEHLSGALLREETSALPAPVLVWDTASGKDVAEWTPPVRSLRRGLESRWTLARHHFDFNGPPCLARLLINPHCRLF